MIGAMDGNWRQKRNRNKVQIDDGGRLPGGNRPPAIASTRLRGKLHNSRHPEGGRWLSGSSRHLAGSFPGKQRIPVPGYRPDFVEVDILWPCRLINEGDNPFAHGSYSLVGPGKDICTYYLISGDDPRVLGRRFPGEEDTFRNDSYCEPGRCLELDGCFPQRTAAVSRSHGLFLLLMRTGGEEAEGNGY